MGDAGGGGEVMLTSSHKYFLVKNLATLSLLSVFSKHRRLPFVREINIFLFSVPGSA